MVDMTFILSNLHRFVRERRRPEPARPAPGRAPVAAARRTEDARFLGRVAVAVILLLVAIAVLWSRL